MQFCADPRKVILRQNAKTLVDAFPNTIPKLTALGYDAASVLNNPIVSAADVAKYVDSLFNACVPLPQPVHTGSITATADRSAGKHTYPTPNDDTVFFCFDDFHPFVYHPKTKSTVQVAPVASRGSGDGRTRVVMTDAAHPLAKKHAVAARADKALTLLPHDPISKAAGSQT